MRKESVVTPQRFQQGFAYPDYIAQIKVNGDRFQHFYDIFRLKPEDADFFRRLVQKPNGPAKCLALGEDWCPDVYRGLPVMAHVAQASGMELRVFPRDQNLDIMDEFLNQGQYRSIPTFVFYTRDHRYLCHWIERPALANREREAIEEQIRREHPNLSEAEFREERRRLTLSRYPAWQQATVDELKDLLARSVQ